MTTATHQIGIELWESNQNSDQKSKICKLMGTRKPIWIGTEFSLRFRDELKKFPNADSAET